LKYRYKYKEYFWIIVEDAFISVIIIRACLKQKKRTPVLKPSFEKFIIMLC